MKKYIFLLTILLISTLGFTYGREDAIIEGRGELHIIYKEEGRINAISRLTSGDILDTTFVLSGNNPSFCYISNDKGKGIRFRFKLHGEIAKREVEKEEKILVISDLHGRLDAFVAFMKGNKVIDDEFNWIFGKNRLIIIGDAFDRGVDDNGILWLIYKLEEEAETAGGRIDFILGNHEDLVLKGDFRYVHKSHLAFSEKTGLTYNDLYSSNTVLGRWLRSKPLIITVGTDLFVHAGISPVLVDNNYTIKEINKLSNDYFGYPTKKKNKLHPRNELLFGSDGALWYRGLVVDTEKYKAISGPELKRVLKYFNVKRIIVGHSEVDDIELRYNGKVIAVNVRHYNNYKADKSAGLLIIRNNIYVVNYSGKQQLIVINKVNNKK